MRKIVVAGGGTAGWLAATALAKQLGSLVDITLVESDEIGTVGVGESTIPTTRTFHAFIGVEENAFLQATQATFKLGISFENWHWAGDRYFHPFGTVGRSVTIADFQHFWLEARRQGVGGDFTDYSPEAMAAAAGRFGKEGAQPLAYAYHLDATAYARFLRSVAEKAGVTRREGRIERVELGPDQASIARLVLASGETVEGDIFLDCTGFRALLTGQALRTGFDDWSEWLDTDSALAVQTERSGPPVPYTRAIAHRAGWRWRIPLQSRVGNGLVYASAHMSEDEARAELAAALEGEHLLFEPRLIRYKTGMRHKAWSGNCIALGLAAGFIEPLESTSIHLVMNAVIRLIQLFPFDDHYAGLRDRFNEQSRAEWEHVRDFIILHYALNARTEPFWRSRATMALPESLRRRIALFEESAAAYQDQNELFRVDSWVSVMLGQGIMPRAHHRIAGMMSAQALGQAFDNLRTGIDAQVAALPTQDQYLRSVCPA